MIQKGYKSESRKFPKHGSVLNFPYFKQSKWNDKMNRKFSKHGLVLNFPYFKQSKWNDKMNNYESENRKILKPGFVFKFSVFLATT